MSFVYKNNNLFKKPKVSFLSNKSWRYLYLLGMSSVHRNSEKKYWSRSTVIPNAFIGDNVLIYSGKRWHSRVINQWMVGYKLGEFTWNRRLALYKAKQLRKKLKKQGKKAK